jgi:hypothetical protein
MNISFIFTFNALGLMFETTGKYKVRATHGNWNEPLQPYQSGEMLSTVWLPRGDGDL